MARLRAWITVAALAFGISSASAQNKPTQPAEAPESHPSEVKEHVKEPLMMSGGEAVVTGIAVFNYFDAKKGAVPPLGTGTGPRSDHKHVSFGKKFSAPPKVMLAISGLDTSADSSATRFETYVVGVDESGFDIKVVTWVSSRIYNLHVSWIAIGK